LVRHKNFVFSQKMLFCPTCAMLLLVENESGVHRFFCQTCPYVHTVQHYVKEVTLKNKREDDIMSLDAWANVDKEKGVPCEACGNDEAYFRQVQTRSADEPTTTFYKCTNNSCQHQWHE